MSCPLKAEVNVNNLITNALSVKNLIGNKVKLCAVVKSNAYGHGGVKVATYLYPYVDSFCVSLESEALDLKIAGIDKEVLLLTPATSSLERLIDNGVTLSVSSKSEALQIAKTAYRLNKFATVHIKLNTGMNRFGANTLYEVNEIISALKDSGVEIVGGYSHFGDVKNSKYVSSQYQNFLRLSDPIKNYSDKALLHLSSSGGVLLGDKYLFSMVRVGLMLYGYTPFKTDKVNLLPVMKIYAKNLGVKEIKNQRLLYGSKKYSEIATLLRCGYADGFLKNTGEITNRCMDVSVVKGANYSDYIPVMTDVLALSKKQKTIPYEILTSLTKRAEFVYLE